MKKILFFSLTALLPLVMMADDITIAEATRIAQEFDLTQRHKAQKAATPQTQQSVQWLTSRIEDGTPLYHIFNRGTGGYVIVSGDDAVRPDRTHGCLYALGYAPTRTDFWKHRATEPATRHVPPPSGDKNAEDPAEIRKNVKIYGYSKVFLYFCGRIVEYALT